MAQDTKAVADREEEIQRATDRATSAEAEVARLREQIAKSDDAGTVDHRVSDEARAQSDSAKQPPSPSSAHDESRVEGGESELRKDPMMAHLLDSLAAGKDIGHYGRLVFAMVARHFLPHEEVIRHLTGDRDFSQEDAELMLRQTEGRDYSPPRRERILEWQSKQEFPILPDPEDPDAGNLYRNLTFPQEVYAHIGHYQEQKNR